MREKEARGKGERRQAGEKYNRNRVRREYETPYGIASGAKG